MNIFNIKQGYTLIELMVAMTILVILATTTAPAVGRAKRAQEIQQSAISLKAKIKEAQSLALAPPKDNLGAIAYGAKIENDPTTGNFSFQLVKKDKIGVTIPYEFSPTTFDTVTSNISSAKYIWFEIGNNAKINFSDAGWTLAKSAIIELSNGTDSRTIIVNGITGAVNIN